MFVQVIQSDTPLDTDTVHKLLNTVRSRLPSLVAEAVLNIPSVKKQIEYKLLQELDKNCTKLCSKKSGSILRRKDYTDMVEFQWGSLFQEMSRRCSFLRDVFVTVAKCSNKSRDPEPPICLCYSILLQQRNHELSLVQRINTVLLSEGNAKKMVNFISNLLLSPFHPRLPYYLRVTIAMQILMHGLEK
mgnify:CR=1 FL=1